MSETKHIPLPKETKAYFCANCGAVALSSDKVCKVMGQGKKADWCGIKGVKPPAYCHNNVNTDRWQCKNCGQISVNPELLCDPEKLEASE